MSKKPIKISNIKIGVKIKTISARALKNLCEKSNVKYKDVGNFIIFKLSDEKNKFKYTYSIFGPKYKKQEKIHTNICGLKEGQIEKSINRLQNFLNYPHENTSYEVNTVTGTIKLGHRINLRHFLESNLLDSANEIKFIPEAFPALYLTRDKITYSIFSTGSVNIVGAKSREAIESNIEYLSKICLESASTNA